MTRIFALLVLGALTLRAAPFANPTLREPTLIQAPSSTSSSIQSCTAVVRFRTCLPGWQVLRGAEPVSTAGYNDVNGRGAVGIIQDQQASGLTLEGRFNLKMYGSATTDVSVVQVGDIPLDAQYLAFQEFYGAFAGLQVRINGEILTNAPASGANERRFDISRFAGQTAELRFIVPAQPNPTSPVWIDSIRIICASGCPDLSIARSGETVIVSCPRSAEGFVLQSTLSLMTPVWQPVVGSMTTNADTLEITLTNNSPQSYFRLYKP